MVAASVLLTLLTFDAITILFSDYWLVSGTLLWAWVYILRVDYSFEV